MNSITFILTSLGAYKVKDGKKETLFSELHSLLSSGLDFSHSFTLLIEGETDRHIKQITGQIYKGVVQGESLWYAMEVSNHFSALDCGVIRIGEQTGRLNESLEFLTDYYHKKIEQRRMVSSAVSYPLIILCTAIVVVIFMLMFIVPMFEQVYARMGGELPTLTRWIIAISKDLPIYLFVVVTLVITTWCCLYAFRETIGVRSVLSDILLRLPIAGGVVRKSNQSHFCKLLYLLTSSGVPLLHGLEMLKSIITLYPYQNSFDAICSGLRRGELFADNLNKYPKLYDKKLTTLLKVGEETNRLPQMLLKQGEDLTKELEYRLRQLGNLLEPLLILLVGALVAVILISMYLPMFKLGGVMG